LQEQRLLAFEADVILKFWTL